MSELATRAQQKRHYDAVRARLMGAVRGPNSSLPGPLPDKPAPHGAPVSLVGLSSSQIILRLVAGRHDITIAELTGRSREQRYMRARIDAAVLLHTHRPNMSLQKIARFLGRKDHTTALHLLKLARLK